MSEEQAKPEASVEEAVKDEVQAPEETKISDEEVKAVEKEIDAKDTQKLEGLSEQFRAELSKTKEELEVQYTQKLNEELAAYKKQIDESYSDKFKAVNERLEEIKPRKGLVDVPTDNPYNELKQEEQEAEAQEAPAKPDLDALRNPDPMTDREGADLFLESLRK